MLSVSEAMHLVRTTSKALATQTLPIEKASGHYLSEAVIAPVDHPIFDQSAMDGYAFRHADLQNGNTFKVVGEIAAGSFTTIPIGPNETYRIFTGAPIPPGANTVMIQEQTKAHADEVTFSTTSPAKGQNVRLKGEQIATGAVALEAGSLLNAPATGFLASLGIKKVNVHLKPRVGVGITGSEFARSAADLNQGKIYESNGKMLASALRKMALPHTLLTVADHPDQMQQTFGELANQHDVLLFTGGVSVGRYDYTKSTLLTLGFETVFHKVRQKPGKPLLLMKRGRQLAFGLPGNPRAAMICFEEYVRTSLQLLAGARHAGLKTIYLPLAHDLRKKSGRTNLMAVNLTPEGVKVAGGQDSHMLQSLAKADALFVFEDHLSELKAGAMVEVHLLPGA